MSSAPACPDKRITSQGECNFFLLWPLECEATGLSTPRTKIFQNLSKSTVLCPTAPESSMSTWSTFVQLQGAARVPLRNLIGSFELKVSHMQRLAGRLRRGGQGARDAPSLPAQSSPQGWRRALTAPAKGGMLKHPARSVSVAVCSYQLGITGRQLETALTTVLLAPLISFCCCCGQFVYQSSVKRDSSLPPTPAPD